jgi:CheY-like chemotaxis protein
MSKARLLVADDNPAILEKAASTLASEFDVVAAVHNRQDALDAVAQLNPEVVLDISMPVLDGIKAAARLIQNNPSAKIVFLTANQDALMCLGRFRDWRTGLRNQTAFATRLSPRNETRARWPSLCLSRCRMNADLEPRLMVTAEQLHHRKALRLRSARAPR